MVAVVMWGWSGSEASGLEGALAAVGLEARVAEGHALTATPALALALGALPSSGILDALLSTRIRQGGPLLFLRDRADDPLSRTVLLERGADDVTGPGMVPRELAARLAAALARRRGRTRRVLRLERCAIDLDAARVIHDDGGVDRLGHGEVALLAALSAHEGQTLDRDRILDLAPADATDPTDRAIDARIARLRAKLGTDRLVAVQGVGYRFDCDLAAAIEGGDKDDQSTCIS